MSRTFIPGPLSSIIFEMYCFTARITFIFDFSVKSTEILRNEFFNQKLQNLYYRPLKTVLPSADIFWVETAENNDNFRFSCFWRGRKRKSGIDLKIQQ